jgi:hypothetical protein
MYYDFLQRLYTSWSLLNNLWFMQQVLSSHDGNKLEYEQLLLITCKCMYFTVSPVLFLLCINSIDITCSRHMKWRTGLNNQLVVYLFKKGQNNTSFVCRQFGMPDILILFFFFPVMILPFSILTLSSEYRLLFCQSWLLTSYSVCLNYGSPTGEVIHAIWGEADFTFLLQRHVPSTRFIGLQQSSWRCRYNKAQDCKKMSHYILHTCYSSPETCW